MKTKKAVDTFSGESSKRGRPRLEQYTTVSGHANNFKTMLTERWSVLKEPLLKCSNAKEVSDIFETYAQPYAQEFVPRLAADILELIQDRKFPQRGKAQIGFIAESLAGRPSITFRTSRDVCAKMRAAEDAKSPYRIIRKEFYVVCECGYKGPTEYNACRKCGAQISFLEEQLSGLMHF
jgi:hypothetical protein